MTDLDPAAATATAGCPACAANLPQHAGFITWCHACGWNLQPQAGARPRSRAEQVYAAAGRRLGARLLADLAGRESLSSRLTPARAAALGLAALVHVLTLAFLVGGLALVLLTWLNPFLAVLGVAFVG